MPELPEVETTKNGVSPHIKSKTVSKVIVRQPRLRWPIPLELPEILVNASLLEVKRRAKYLLMDFTDTNSGANPSTKSDTDSGALMIHLGMSGSLRIVEKDTPILKHDHVDIIFHDNTTLRYCDPRRFGCILWLGPEPEKHKLLSNLGPEPLSEQFDTNHLWQLSRTKKTTVKQFIMDQKIVVGIGNIYATEALFTAGIKPNKPAGKVTRAQYEKFVYATKQILEHAIKQGGTTLRDFVGGDGKPGYFKQELQAYGRAKQPCVICETPLNEIKLNNRASVFCPHCQN